MPLHWTIDHDTKRIVASAEGDVTRAEFEAFLDAMSSEKALAYPKLFDGTTGDTAMEASDLLIIAARIRAYHALPVGPLAVVLTDDKTLLVERILGALAAAKRPMKVFSSRAAAQRWLDRLAREAERRGVPVRP